MAESPEEGAAVREALYRFVAAGEMTSIGPSWIQRSKFQSDLMAFLRGPRHAYAKAWRTAPLCANALQRGPLMRLAPAACSP